MHTISDRLLNTVITRQIQRNISHLLLPSYYCSSEEMRYLLTSIVVLGLHNRLFFLVGDGESLSKRCCNVVVKDVML